MNNILNLEELVKKSIFHLDNNRIFTQYLLPSEFSPLKEKSMYGSWLLVFHSEELITLWLSYI